jgi:hypothetical protein
MTEESKGQPTALPDIASVRRVALAAERRLRLGRALRVGVGALSVSLGVACVVLVLRKTGLVGESFARGALVGLALASVVAGIVGYVRRLDATPLRAGALALDRFHALSDRLASALAFGAVASPTPFMVAAMDDAIERVPATDPRRAVPIPVPPHLRAAGVLAVALAGIALFEVRHHVVAPHAATIDAVDVTADDLDAMRDFLAEMKAHEQTDDAKAATREFNQLIEDLAARRLDRTEAFRRMQQLEDKLLEGREADAKALEDAMKKIGEEMKAADLTKPAGEALDAKNLVDAEKQLRDLAERLRNKDKPIDKTQLDKMRAALSRAAKTQAKRQESLAQRREELRQDLLNRRNKQPDGGAQSDEEKSLLQKRERELERLDRETQQAESTGRQLDRLDRELSQAAEDLMKDLGLSADDLDKSAEDINHMKQEEMSQEQKEQLRQKLQELREMLRQQGQGGQGQMARLRRFQRQARGQSGSGRGQQGQGQGQEGEGQEQEGQGEQGQGQGQTGQGQDGNGGEQSPGGGGHGQGQRGGEGDVWVLGPNGEKMLMLARGSGSSPSGGSVGSGQGKPGPGWGTQHEGNVEGKATNSGMGTQDTQVAGQDTGNGASRSEVIEGAAERGFASRGYTKVYREYETVAEEALGKDEIPGGYRFYVRRYFELIRPRAERDDGASGPKPNETKP